VASALELSVLELSALELSQARRTSRLVEPKEMSRAVTRPRMPSGEVQATVSRIKVPPSTGSNSCVWRSEAKAPRCISSTNSVGRSKATMREVRRWRRPRWTASKVTVWFSSMRPCVTPATAFSRVKAQVRQCSPMSRARSKQRAGGAAMKVSKASVGMAQVLAGALPSADGLPLTGFSGCLQLA